jgi:Domain of unknown function (DUF4292)
MRYKNSIFSPLLRQFILLALVSSLFSAKETGCNRARGNAAAVNATEARPANYLLKKLQNHDLSKVKYLNAQAKIHVDGDGQSMSANANIIWIRDSIMWVNVKKFGLEAARALITKDSIFMLNRLNRTWSARGLESLEREYSLPDGFGLLQQFILASAWLDPKMEMRADIKDNLHRLSGSNGMLSADYRVEEGSFLLRSQTFLQSRDSRNVSLSFDNFKKTQLAGQFPYLRRIEAFSPETGNLSLEIELTDVEINVPKNFRFEIPGSYDKVE